MLGLSTSRPVTATEFDQAVAGLEAPTFASASDVTDARDQITDKFGFPSVPAAGYARPLSDTLLLDLSPGVVGLRRIRSSYGEPDAPWRDDSMTAPLSLFELDHPDDLDAVKAGRSVITEWSKPSQARMVKKVGQLDYSNWDQDGGTLALMTLTLPGDWLPLVPTGKDFKRLLELLRRRWVRAGMQWRGLWKLEFQKRGAPHLHALVRVPGLVGTGDTAQRFEEWIGRTWVDIVNPDNHWCHRCHRYRTGIGSIALPAGAGALIRHTDPCDCGTPETDRARMLSAHLPSAHRQNGVLDFSGVKFSDPKRTAVYFLKHSSKTQDGKEYQHIVPRAWREPGAGPGRFWGVWALDTAVATVEVPEPVFFRLRRVIRGLSRARSAAQLLLVHEHSTLTLDQYKSKGDGFRRWRAHNEWSVALPESARRHSLSLPAMTRRRFLSDHRDGGWALVSDGIGAAFDLASASTGPACICFDTPDVRTVSQLTGPDARRQLARARRDLGRVDGSVKVIPLEQYDTAAGILRVDLPRSSVCAHCYPAGRSQRLV